MNAQKVILDCDPGIDDSLAIMLALSCQEIDVVGITIVCGNVPVSKGVQNACKVLSWMGRTDIPVYKGEEKPLVRPYVDAMDTHGEDGLGQSGFSVPDGCTVKDDAVEYLESVFTAQEDVSVIALGPLTNLARLLERNPAAFCNIRELVSMGGTYKSHGNCSPVAEYNYWCDPDAAAQVYTAFSSLPKLKDKVIHMVGLDVTRKIVLTPNILEYMKNINPALGQKIEAITRFYFDFHWKQEGVIGCVLNDPLAVAYFADRSLCHGFTTYTAVETTGISYGQTLCDAFQIWNRPHNSKVLTQVDAKKFMMLFLCRVLGAQPDQASAVLDQISAGEVLA